MLYMCTWIGICCVCLFLIIGINDLTQSLYFSFSFVFLIWKSRKEGIFSAIRKKESQKDVKLVKTNSLIFLFFLFHIKKKNFFLKDDSFIQRAKKNIEKMFLSNFSFLRRDNSSFSLFFLVTSSLCDRLFIIKSDIFFVEIFLYHNL